MNIQGSRKSRIKKQSTTALVTKLKRLELLTDNRRPSHSSIAEQLSDRGEQQETTSSVQNTYKKQFGKVVQILYRRKSTNAKSQNRVLRWRGGKPVPIPPATGQSFKL